MTGGTWVCLVPLPELPDWDSHSESWRRDWLHSAERQAKALARREGVRLVGEGAIMRGPFTLVDPATETIAHRGGWVRYTGEAA